MTPKQDTFKSTVRYLLLVATPVVSIDLLPLLSYLFSKIMVRILSTQEVCLLALVKLGSDPTSPLMAQRTNYTTSTEDLTFHAVVGKQSHLYAKWTSENPI